MTALLLDTNAIAALVSRDRRLKPVVSKSIFSAERVFVSAVSFYEIGQKVRLGKWPEMSGLIDDLEANLTNDGFELVPVTAGTAKLAALLDWAHRDPFDRIIAAVALQERVPLVSSDTAFDLLGIERVW